MSLEKNEILPIQITAPQKQPNRVADDSIVFSARQVLSQEELTTKPFNEAFSLVKDKLSVRWIREKGHLSQFARDYNFDLQALVRDALTYRPERITFIYQNGSLDIDNGEVNRAFNLLGEQKNILRVLYERFDEEVKLTNIRQNVEELKTSIDQVAPGVLETSYRFPPESTKLSGVNFFWIDEEPKIKTPRTFSYLEIAFAAAIIKTPNKKDDKPEEIKSILKKYNFKPLFRGKKSAEIKEYKRNLTTELLNAVSTPDGALDLMGGLENVEDIDLWDVINWLHKYSQNKQKVRTTPVDNAPNPVAVSDLASQRQVKEPQKLEDQDKEALSRIEKLIERWPADPNSDRRLDSQQLGKVMGIGQIAFKDAIEDKKIISPSILPTWGGHYECNAKEYIRLAYFIKYGKFKSMDRKYLDGVFDEAYEKALAEHNKKREKQISASK